MSRILTIIAPAFLEFTSAPRERRFPCRSKTTCRRMFCQFLAWFWNLAYGASIVYTIACVGGNYYAETRFRFPVILAAAFTFLDVVFFFLLFAIFA